MTPAVCDFNYGLSEEEEFSEGYNEEEETIIIPHSTNNSNNNDSNNLCGDKEKVGRWTEQEHQVFLQGLHTYGKQWKTIAGMIGTRTVVQVRTHAQKYFQKMERSSSTSSNGAVTAADFCVVRPLKVKQQQQGGRSPSASKRKSLPTNLPSRKKSRKASSVRLSMGTRASSTTQLLAAAVGMPNNDEFVYQVSAPEVRYVISFAEVIARVYTILYPKWVLLEHVEYSLMIFAFVLYIFSFTTHSPSFPSFISKSASSSSGSENWSTISPNAVVNMVDLQQQQHPYDDDDSPEDAAAASFDLLGEDPLEWLIETDCTQQYLPESSLPLFPFLHDDVDTEQEEEEELHAPQEGPGMVQDALFHNLVDPNVTMQSLFLPTTNDVIMQQ